MWLDDDRIAELLGSSDPSDVAQAIAAFAEREADCDTPQVEPPSAEALVVFGDGIPEDTFDHFLALVVSPASSFARPAERAGATLAEVCLRAGDLRNGFQGAMALKVHPDARVASAAAVERAGALIDGLDPERREPAAYFISCLLDGAEAVRDTVFAALDNWPSSDAHRDTVQRLAGHLDAERGRRLPFAERGMSRGAAR